MPDFDTLTAPVMGVAPLPALGFTDIFVPGIGPSSSHTVGPMRAARDFAVRLARKLSGSAAIRLQCDLFGSLALTGRGHATDTAVIMGLCGECPETVDPSLIASRIGDVIATGTVVLCSGATVPFDAARNLVFHMGQFLPGHPNALTFTAELANGEVLRETYFSIGGGAIRREGEALTNARTVTLSHPFATAAQLLALCETQNCTMADLVLANESAWRSEPETRALLDATCAAMNATIDRGLLQEGILPGGLGVPRRARRMHEALRARGPRPEPASVLEWVSLWALAVNEENAAGGRVVTAPTNGAAGVIPAVMRYYACFVGSADRAGIHRFLLTAAAIGMLYKIQASVSAAEMGCQGEVGVACSMAAGGLAAALGASPQQVENAAEIGMEHNLGLTCDPIGGLVQIPCIERNTMGAIKAINAAMLALHGDGSHKVSLDQVIETMRQTGADMHHKYKETSLGGLAVNVVEC